MKKWPVFWRHPAGNYLNLLVNRYGFSVDAFDGVALSKQSQNARLPAQGGIPDLEKAALMLLQDYRTGALGGSAWNHQKAAMKC